MEDFLPIGSKVRLNDGRILMIIGYLPSKPNDEIIYDYICSRNRYGLLKRKEDLKLNRDIFYIKNEDIRDVLYLGFTDVEYVYLKTCASNVKDDLNNAKEVNSQLDQDELNELYLKDFKKAIGKHGEDENEE